ncbi:MAG: hypothetical protein Q9166_001661 [cf. Caloplaca sp. 2 TL-2023]
MRTSAWRKFPVSLSELCLETTLRCGQSFRWRKIEDTWLCALHGRVLSLRQDATHLYYQAAFPKSSLESSTPPSSEPGSTSDPLPEDDDTEALVQHYLNLDPNLTELYEQWSNADANFKEKAPRFAGIRILKQDAWEALQQQHHKNFTDGMTPYHDMPSPSVLTDPKVESHLRQLGFGYRAKYIYQTAVQISQTHKKGWLDSLRNPESPVMGQKVAAAGEMQPEGREGYRVAHEELLALQGVGPKVADCVCLMGLGWGEAVPVDTHVWQIAQRDYKFGKGKHNSLTKATYDAVGNRFRSLWGKEAGWAHSVLFTADLRVFSERLSTKIELNEVKVEEVDKNLDDRLESQAFAVTKIEVAGTKIKRELDEGAEHDGSVVSKKATRIKRRKRSYA